jgi:hypothetical protein
MRGIVDPHLRRRPIRDDFVLCYNDIRVLLRCVRREMGGDDEQDANGYSKLTMVSRKGGGILCCISSKRQRTKNSR